MIKLTLPDRTTCLVLALGLAAIVFFRAPPNAANLDITPDAVEYVVGAERLIHLGRYTIEVAGEEYPPRYPPFFSLLLAPFLQLGQGNYGWAILPVFLFGLLGAYLAFTLASRLGGLSAGCLAVAVLLLQPMVRFWGRQVMTDVPFVALTLLSAALFLRAASAADGWNFRQALSTGSVIALATALRPVGLALIGPFLLLPLLMGRPFRNRLMTTIYTALPVVAVLLIQHLYNAATFGDPFRNGYHFWTPVPYDYSALLFSATYVELNLRTFLFPAYGARILAALLLAIALLRTKWLQHRKPSIALRPGLAPLSGLIVFALAGPLWISVFHLFYAFPEGRFHMPLVSVLTVIASGLWGRIIPLTPRLLQLGMLSLIILAMAIRLLFPLPPPDRYLSARHAADVTPRDAVIITTGQLVFWEPLVVRGTARRLLPLSRSYEYAGKIIAHQKIQDPQPPPMFYGDHLCAGLLAGGAQFAVPTVAAERLDQLRALAGNQSLYLDLSELQTQDEPLIQELRNLFIFTPAGPALYHLTPHDETSRPANRQP
jgi:4-amino-4-deoxy-L-arabinose transferase-like glycosyltransferase